LQFGFVFERQSYTKATIGNMWHATFFSNVAGHYQKMLRATCCLGSFVVIHIFTLSELHIEFFRTSETDKNTYLCKMHL
jgi:hypothetical protein